jgi:hypothetical protein
MIKAAWSIRHGGRQPRNLPVSGKGWRRIAKTGKD